MNINWVEVKIIELKLNKSWKLTTIYNKDVWEVIDIKALLKCCFEEEQTA